MSSPIEKATLDLLLVQSNLIFDTLTRLTKFTLVGALKQVGASLEESPELRCYLQDLESALVAMTTQTQKARELLLAEHNQDQDLQMKGLFSSIPDLRRN